jgi:hypothetical protein
VQTQHRAHDQHKYPIKNSISQSSQHDMKRKIHSFSIMPHYPATHSPMHTHTHTTHTHTRKDRGITKQDSIFGLTIV